MAQRRLTCDTGKELSCKLLNVTARKRDELVALQKVKDALAEQIGHDADVVLVVEGVSEVDALVPIWLVVLGEGGEDAQLDARSVSVLLHRADNLDGDVCRSLVIPGLDDLAKGALAQQAANRICSKGQESRCSWVVHMSMH